MVFSDLALLPIQVGSLLGTFATASVTVCVLFSVSVVRIALRQLRLLLGLLPSSPTKTATATTRWYRAAVHHARTKPVDHRFSYDVRVAVVDLDNPPAYYDAGANDTMTADRARGLAGTDGPVWLLTDPSVGGYVQNPISLYYCYDKSDVLVTCIAEVTNTPWGDRVTFSFDPTDPSGASLPKVLHVSPLMDMKNVWTLKTKDPRKSDRLYLRVSVDHAELGKYFDAVIEGRVDRDSPYERNETANLAVLLKYGFQPQRVALWIYWHAVCLLWKGVPFYGPPGLAACQRQSRSRESGGRGGRGGGGGCAAFKIGWRPAQSWVWRERPSE